MRQHSFGIIASSRVPSALISMQGHQMKKDTEETVVSTFGMLIGSRIYRWGLDGVHGVRLSAVQIDKERMYLTFGDKRSDYAGRAAARHDQKADGTGGHTKAVARNRRAGRN
jgi:hypothetical protein